MSADEPTQVTWHEHAVERQQRETRNGHRGCVVWFTGLSGCGKSTVANVVDQLLFQRNVQSYLLDGDNVRHGLNAGPQMLVDKYGTDFAERFGLGFSETDRCENIRRIGAVAELFASAGIVTLTAFVSPFRRDRDAARQTVENARSGDFVEVFIDTPLEICEQRDPKGLYKKARAGQIKDFTGIDSPYETPSKPELTLDGAAFTPPVLGLQVVNFLQSRGVLGERQS